MDEDGQVRIVGRYKDMIIRAGENISPSAIESLLFGRFDLLAEIVGLPDEIAREIPIAIVKKEGQEVDPFKIRELLVKELGPVWVPEEITDVESLGIDDYPRTSTGKVQKIKLREILMKQRTSQSTIATGENMLEMLTRLWTKLLAVGPNTLTPEISIHDWADSLILARFSAVLYREAGLQMSLQEIMEHATITAQAKFLSDRGSSAAQAISDITPKRESPPSVDDMAHTLGDPARAKRREELSNKTLAPLGLSWNDVENVIPMNSIHEMFMKHKRPQTSSHRHPWACPSSSIADVQKAVEGAVAHHSMLRTMAMYFDFKTSLHITIRPSAKWFSKCITIVDPIKTADDLNTCVYNDPKLDFTAFPGPMFRFVITHIQDENCASLIYMVQHSVFDGVSLPLFIEDLDTLLSNPTTTLKAHVPYKAWADNYYNLQDSAIARSHVESQVQRL